MLRTESLSLCALASDLADIIAIAIANSPTLNVSVHELWIACELDGYSVDTFCLALDLLTEGDEISISPCGMILTGTTITTEVIATLDDWQDESTVTDMSVDSSCRPEWIYAIRPDWIYAD